MATIEGIIAQLQNYREELAEKLAQVDAMLSAAKKQAGKKTAGSTTCELCGKTFQTGGALGSHKVIVHGLPGTSQKATARRERTARKKQSQQEFKHYDKPENREPAPGAPRTRPVLGATVHRRGDRNDAG